jgi:surfeit locus 1 family protein
VIRRLPVLATLIVLVAVGIMVRLGLWQMDRMHEKDALLARYAQAANLPAAESFPQGRGAAEPVLYRRAQVDCVAVTGTTSIAGRSAGGEAGMAHVAHCRLAGGGSADVVLGWSRAPNAPAWRGGPAMGTIAPGPRLIADPPLAGLAASARPDPADIPNNHWSYAVQWFLFAGTALVIYALALRKRLAGLPPRG